MLKKLVGLYNWQQEKMELKYMLILDKHTNSQMVELICLQMLNLLANTLIKQLLDLEQ